MVAAAKVILSPHSISSLFGGSMDLYSPSRVLDTKMRHAVRLSRQPIFQTERKENGILQPSGKKRRHVHFDVTKCEKIDAQAHVEEIATEVVDEGWISQEQLFTMQKRQRYDAGHILYKSPNYYSSIRALMDTHKDLDGSKKVSLKRHISCVSEADCRGLERHVVDKLNHLRKENVRITLSLQTQLKERGLWGTDYAREMIRKRSASISRPLRQLASHLAQLDEWEAKQGTPYTLK